MQGCLVALQSDLKDHSTVSEETARGLAKKHGLEFFSVSSVRVSIISLFLLFDYVSRGVYGEHIQMTGKNVDKPFEYLSRIVAEHYSESLKVFGDE